MHICISQLIQLTDGLCHVSGRHDRYLFTWNIYSADVFEDKITVKLSIFIAGLTDFLLINHETVPAFQQEFSDRL